MTLTTEIVSHKYRTFKTLIFYFGYMTLGLCTAIKGPALLDLQLATSSTVEEVTRILPAESLGFVFGSILCAAIVSWIDSQWFIISGLLFYGMSTIFIPFNSRSLLLCVDSIVVGFFSGFVHTGGNVWMQDIWAKAAPPFMQALHFSFGLGALCGPLLVQPFLLPLNEDQHNKNNDSNNTAYLKTFGAEDVKIKLPYGIAGGLSILACIAFSMVYLYRRKDTPHPSTKWCDEDGNKNIKNPSGCSKFTVIAAGCLFMFMYFGLELGFGYLLTTYAVKSKLKLPKATGSLMTSAFWAMFTFFRCSTVFVIDHVGCQNVVAFDMILVMASNIVLLCLSRTHEWALWLGVALMGSGLSSVFAAMLGFMTDIVPVTSQMTSILMVSCAFGNFVIPHIVGKFVDDFPEVFLILNGVAGLGCTLLFGFLVCIKNRVRKA